MLRSSVCNMKQAVQLLATEISRGAASGSSSRLFLDRPSMDGHAQGPFFSAVASVFLQFVEMSHSFCVPISSVAICTLISCNGSFRLDANSLWLLQAVSLLQASTHFFRWVSMERIEVDWLLQIMEVRRLTEVLPILISTLTRLPESQLLGKTAEVGLNSSNHVCGVARLLWVMSVVPQRPPLHYTPVEQHQAVAGLSRPPVSSDCTLMVPCLCCFHCAQRLPPAQARSYTDTACSLP